jgi:outer membrane protein
MKMKSVAAVAAGIGMLVGAATLPAAAGDSNGNFQIKLGVTGVLMDNETTSLQSSNLGDILVGRGAEVNDEVIPTATLTYYFNRNLAVELFCCAAQISVEGSHGLKGNGELATSWTFPPILTLQYHFDGFGPFRPYLGLGAQWVHFFDSKVGDNGLGATDVEFDDAFGVALQAGFNYDLGAGWSLGLDVKKTFIETEVTFKTPGALGTVVAKHEIDPLFITANIGYRFNLFGPARYEPLK